MNGLTHWIDGSQIYGNNPVTAQNLRDTSSGRGLLKISLQGNRALLPVANTCCPGDPTNSCAAAQFCFFAGTLLFSNFLSLLSSSSTKISQINLLRRHESGRATPSYSYAYYMAPRTQQSGKPTVCSIRNKTN